MNELEQHDFLATFGDEFCELLASTVGCDNIVRQDAYEVFLRVFDQEPILTCYLDSLLARWSNFVRGANNTSSAKASPCPDSAGGISHAFPVAGAGCDNDYDSG